MLGNNWFKKERPLLGLLGSGGGISGGAAGGPSANPSFTLGAIIFL